MINGVIMYLEDGEHGDGERVEVWRWGPVWEVEGASEELHPQQGKNQDEQEQEQQEGYDGFHGAEQWYDQVAQGRPVPKNKHKKTCIIIWYVFGKLHFIHASTIATDDHKYSPLPSSDFDSSGVLVSFSTFIFT